MVQEEDEHDLPDYLCAELEFLHYLALNEGLARENRDLEGAKRYLRGQKEFLERHLLPWLPGLCAQIKGIEGLLFYPQLAPIALRITSADYQLVNRLAAQD